MHSSYQLLVYITKKIVTALLTIFLVITVTFFIMRSIPGTFYGGEKGLSDAVIQNIQAKYHLNEPLSKQYTTVLGNAFKLDFGYSMLYEGRRVNDIIATHFPISALLGLAVAFISIIGGGLSGIIISKKKKGLANFILTIGITLGMSVPSFAMAAILQYLFSVKLEIFPVIAGNDIMGYFLPAFCLSIYPSAFLAKMIGNGIVEIMQKGYITGARARGIPEKRIINVHALRNVILPLFSYIGPLLANLLVGSFVIETIFSIPGLGRYYILSVADRDYTTIMGITFFYSFILVSIILFLDIVLVFVDPRVKINNQRD